MNKCVFRISNFFKFGNGGGVSQNLIEVELSDYAYPYTLDDAWEWAVAQVADNIHLENIDELKSVTISYEGELE